MRKMKRSDVREWTPGEPIERVDFGNGCTGMNKSIPKEPGSAGDFKRLIWKCRAIEADGGPCLDVLPSEYWIDDVKQAGYYDVLTCTSNYGIFAFDAVGPLIDVDIFVRCLKIAYNFWVFAEFIRIGDDLRQRCSQRRRNALQLLIIGNGVQFEDPP